VRLRRYMSVSLGWWHNYKWATKMIGRIFSSDFFVPYFHHLFPDRTFNINSMSHSALVTLCSYIRLAYPLFRQQLSQSLNGHICARKRALLTNLRDLCQFFIPVVYNIHKTMHVCNTTYTHIVNYIYINIQINVYICICMYIYIYLYIYIQTYIYILYIHVYLHDRSMIIMLR